MKAGQLSKIKQHIIPLQGGVDSVTTPALVQPGKLLSSLNFEPDINGGYRRMAGIERYSGQPRPSDASYWIMEVDTSGSFNVGDTITGVTSGVTGEIVLITSVAVVSSGDGGFFDLLALCGITVSSPSTANLSILILAKVTGDFTVGETLNVGGSPQGTVVDVDQDNAETAELHAQYKNLAADSVRADISTPAGSGAIRGIWHYKGDEYCFRDNAGGTECIMYKATSSGWSALSFGREIQFDGATGEIFEGDTVQGQTSGATGVVKRALLRTGTWSTSGVGTLVFDNVTGTFQNDENLRVGGVNKAVADGADSAITLQPGGTFEFDNINFYGTSDTLRMYFADGVNYIHEFDGTRIVPIRTGIGDDKPKYIKGHKNHLFAAIDSSVQVSGTGDPYSWTALTGAAELGLGEECTGLLPQVGDATTGVLVVTTLRKVFILYGNDSSDFSLTLHAPETGARPYTLQNIGYAHFMDAKGVTQLQASQAFGGFEMSILTKAMQPFIDEKQGKETASCIVRFKNQYRVFFNDGEGLIVYFQPGNVGINVSLMPFNYGTDKYMNRVCSFVDADGTERIMAGGSDGYVYEIDRGTSLDGNKMGAYFMTTFIYSKSISLRKRYRRAKLQLRAGNTAQLSVNYDLSHGDLDATYGDFIDKSATGPGGIWDVSSWGQFYWDSSYMQRITIDAKGTGDSIAILVSNDTDEDDPFTIHTLELNYFEGRMNR
ncbi:MAG: hypothetical protein H6937_02465 [Burkholderiales bacterium]|nr:hypothetical protein [Burkholderiales bacterium]